MDESGAYTRHFGNITAILKHESVYRYIYFHIYWEGGQEALGYEEDLSVIQTEDEEKHYRIEIQRQKEQVEAYRALLPPASVVVVRAPVLEGSVGAPKTRRKQETF